MSQADFYVSPQGDDGAPGTLEKPFATLDRARRAVRELQSGKPATVLLRGGTYTVRHPVVFGTHDSGTEQAPITYAAYPGETPIISGGAPERFSRSSPVISPTSWETPRSGPSGLECHLHQPPRE